ncbi:unnamed protein product [Paramecium sonneborni]|uniref:Uncharacterized protein n=1 Tax=Paramecium sonneborni TaxID=65129 RepID=A0A8S1KV03_9CILI|nr:unnamed protein product [Paramecium sonneborni]
MFDKVGTMASQIQLENPEFNRGASKSLYQVQKKNKKCC